MGELWVLLEFANTKGQQTIWDNVAWGPWISMLPSRSHDFTPEGRIAWVDVEGIPFKFWSGKTFKKIATKWGELLDVDDHDEMSFHSKRICIHTKICSNICENFKIVLQRVKALIRAKEATGWIPEFSEDDEDDDHSEQEFISSEQSDLGLHIDGEDNGASEVPETIFENSDGMKERQSEDPFGLYSILNKNKVKSDVIREVNDENPSLKYPPGFTPSLEEVPLGGSAYTWCHKSASKMSKLDRFLILGKMLLGMINAMRNLCGKLKFLRLQASEVAQKAKIKWYVEGDENTKFFHGMLNKKRSQLNIRGIMINGTWTDNPKAVKQEFFQHFRNRFDKPPDQNAHIDMPFPNSLSTDQQKDLECMVSKEEVKRAVWDCGTDKSPGPDEEDFKTALISKGSIPCKWEVLTEEFQSTRSKAASSSLNILHLFYADDAIISWAMNDPNIDTLVHVMEFFYRVSGLRINLCKSKIMGIHVDADRIKSAASKLGCLSHFFHGHDPRSKKASWVNWNKRIKAIHSPEGGLITDVRRVADLRGPLLCRSEDYRKSSLVNSFRESEKCMKEFQLDNPFRWLGTITLSSAVDCFSKFQSGVRKASSMFMVVGLDVPGDVGAWYIFLSIGYIVTFEDQCSKLMANQYLVTSKSPAFSISFLSTHILLHLSPTVRVVLDQMHMHMSQ
ncbi:RNA-directed DNA polymerase, eukaryota, reverse transcriptase zinc-binding domain protein [Tanacetum coccineum]